MTHRPAALVLAAGLATRLTGLREHRGNQVRREAEKHAPEGMTLRFLEEPELYGTGGTLLEAERLGAHVGLVINAFTGMC